MHNRAVVCCYLLPALCCYVALCELTVVFAKEKQRCGRAVSLWLQSDTQSSYKNSVLIYTESLVKDWMWSAKERRYRSHARLLIFFERFSKKVLFICIVFK